MEGIPPNRQRQVSRFHKGLLTLFALGLIISGVQPQEYFTWFLEVSPAIIGAIVLIITFKRFEFTRLTYVFILIHSYILFIGGHYTYAEVPAFDWLAEVLGQERNNYDKIGHFAQGFIPAMIVREVFIRNEVVSSRGWRELLVVSFCLAFSAFYELLEWWVAAATGDSAEAFLGTQGYQWDTQSDMFLAMIGSALMILILGRTQENRIRVEFGT